MPPKRSRKKEAVSPTASPTPPPPHEVHSSTPAPESAEKPPKLTAVTSLFPLTWPVPSPLAVPDLVPIADASWETTLQQSGSTSERVWLSYIFHVLEHNHLTEPLPAHAPLPAPDPEFAEAGPLLGFLGNGAQRLALQRITFVFERALAEFPRSYVLHAQYLMLRSRFVLGRPKRYSQEDAYRRTITVSRNRGPADEVRAHALAGDESEAQPTGDDDFGPNYWDLDSALDGILGAQEWLSLAAAFERSLTVMPRMPRLWVMYLSIFLHPNCPPLLSHTFARRTFDRALRTLPPTLHTRVWRIYLPWATARVRSIGAGAGAPLGRETGIRVWRRFVAVDSTLTEHYVSLLLEAATEAPDKGEDSDDEQEEDQADAAAQATARNQSRAFVLEAAKRLLGLARGASMGEYISPNGKSAHQLFLDWMDIATKHPDAVGMNLEEEEQQRLQRHIPPLGVDLADKAALPVHQADTGDDNNLPPIPGRFGAQVSEKKENMMPAQARDKTKLTEQEATNVSALWANDADPTNSSRQPIGLLILAEGVPRFIDQAGRLWAGLATYYLTRAEFSAAIRVFELGVRTAYTMRDFTLTFDAYAETLESTLTFLMEELAELHESYAPDDEVAAKGQEVDEGLQRFDALISRRPWLVNESLLRRNPHDVAEWEKRIALITATADGPEGASVEEQQRFHDQANARVAQTYARAVDTVSAARATADLSRLFSAFADFYEQGGLGGQAAPDLDSARAVYRRATSVPFRDIEELAEVWCRWAEFELRHSQWTTALSLLASAVAAPRKSLRAQIRYHDSTRPPQERLWRSLKVWSFYLDLSEAVGGMAGTKNAYETILSLKLATPQIITNYALFLESEGYFEDSLKVYQRGIDLLGYPAAFELWNILLGKFVRRYGGSKMERARDLFEQALDGIPPKFAKPILLLYGKLEEEYGLARRALSVYQRGTQMVDPKDKFDMYVYYIAKTASVAGLPATRAIYETAITQLPDKQAAEMSIRFAALERKLGEVDRARAIYAYGAQFVDPRQDTGFWVAWNAFEVDAGSEETFREMLRIKRSVQAQFNTDVANIAASAATQAQQAQGFAQVPVGPDQPMDADQADPMQQVEARAIPGFVKATTTAVQPAPVEVANEEAIGGADNDEDLL